MIWLFDKSSTISSEELEEAVMADTYTPEPQVDIFTDGACKGNPGPGGWAAILRYKDQYKEIYGKSDGVTTNNRMELTAVAEALKCLKKPCSVTIHSDSQYVCNAFNKNWISSWQKIGWRDVKNSDLWQTLLSAMSMHTVNYVWIRGHSGNLYNERCDHLATKMAET